MYINALSFKVYKVYRVDFLVNQLVVDREVWHFSVLRILDKFFQKSGLAF